MFRQNAGSNMCGPKTSKVPMSYYPQMYTDVPIYQGKTRAAKGLARVITTYIDIPNFSK